MPSKSSILALIPARGGSKGLPGKNLAKVGIHSLIGWSIKAALESPSVDRVVVSTDDEAIAAESRNCGAEVPFMRPPELASDTAKSVDVAIHCLDTLKETGYDPTWLVLLQPTSPLRTAEDIEATVALAKARECDAIVSVNEPSQHPLLAKSLDPEGFITSYFLHDYSRRQDMPVVYNPNGAIYLIKVESLRSQKSFCPEASRAYIMPLERSLDIDATFDLELCRFIVEGQLSERLRT